MKLTFKLTYEAALWLIKKNIRTLLLLSLFNCAIYYIYSYSASLLQPSGKSNMASLSVNLLIFSAISILISVLSTLFGYYLLITLVSRDIVPPIPFIKQLRYICGRLIPLYLTSAFYGIIVGFGTVFFIIPGIIFAIKYSQATMFALIEGDNQSDAFKHSAEVTKGNYFRIIKLIVIFGMLYVVILLPVMMLPIPQFFKILFYSFIFFLSEIINYVIWKILKQNFYNGKTSQQTTTPLWRKIYITVLIVFILVMAGIAIKSLATSNKKFNNTFLVPSLAPTLTKINETNSWQTYVNEKYGYRIQYPPDFKVQSLLGGPDADSNISPSIIIRSSNNLKYIYVDVQNIPPNEAGELMDYVNKKMSAIRTSNPLHLARMSEINHHQAVFMANDKNTLPQLLEVYIQKTPSQVLKIRMGTINSVSKEIEKEYKDFFYLITSTVKFNK